MDDKKLIYSIITAVWNWIKANIDKKYYSDWDETDEEWQKIYDLLPDKTDSDAPIGKFTYKVTNAAWELVTEISKRREE